MTYIQRISTLVLLIAMLSVGVLFTPQAKAELITEAQVAAQQEVVKARLLVTMEEQVKLLQMILIRHLEARVLYLESLR